MQNLAKQGVQKIVLDLRGVAGGSLAEGVAAANLFVKDGDLAKVIGQKNTVLKTFTADPSKAVFEGPVAILTDLGTAGAAEVVTSAILEHKRGDVVGERTFGAGTEQQLFTLHSGDGLLLTVSKWASGGGVPFLGEDRASMGIKPTVEIKRTDAPEPLDPDNPIDQQDPNNPQPKATPKPAVQRTVEDIQLKRALEILTAKSA